MARVVFDAKLLSDDLGHQPGAPQLGVVPQGLRSSLENAFELSQVRRTQQRFATRATSFLQAGSTRFGQCARPPVHRLPMYTKTSRDFGLAQASLQQTSCFESSLFESIKIPSYASWISHVPNSSRDTRRCQLYYVILNSSGRTSNAGHLHSAKS